VVAYVDTKKVISNKKIQRNCKRKRSAKNNNLSSATSSTSTSSTSSTTSSSSLTSFMNPMYDDVYTNYELADINSKDDEEIKSWCTKMYLPLTSLNNDLSKLADLSIMIHDQGGIRLSTRCSFCQAAHPAIHCRCRDNVPSNFYNPCPIAACKYHLNQLRYSNQTQCRDTLIDETINNLIKSKINLCALAAQKNISITSTILPKPTLFIHLDGYADQLSSRTPSQRVLVEDRKQADNHVDQLHSNLSTESGYGIYSINLHYSKKRINSTNAFMNEFNQTITSELPRFDSHLNYFIFELDAHSDGESNLWFGDHLIIGLDTITQIAQSLENALQQQINYQFIFVMMSCNFNEDDMQQLQLIANIQ
jgi:hypothetical protein